MSQNIPPNENEGQGGQGHVGGDDAPAFARDREQANPYFGYGRSEPEPNLDADAPALTANEVQRLNRKALIFLLGIVVILVAVAIFFFKGAGSSPDPVKTPPPKVVDVPDLPNASQSNPPVAETAQPVPLDINTVPPLPDDGSGQRNAGNSGRQAQQGPSLLERRLVASGGADGGGYAQQNGQGAPGGAGQSGGAGGSSDDGAQVPSSAQPIYNPDTLLVEGTYIRCVLQSRIITDIPGFTSCIVTEPVYSINGRKLLLPKGSKVLGSYDTDANGPRVAVIWERITTPNGFDINMRSPGVDNLGSAGHPGKYNAHWPSRMASALMISLVADAFKYAAAKNGPEQTTVTTGGFAVQSPYESATARTMEQLANQALRKSINRPATVTINQGTVLNIYVAKDVDFAGVLPTTGSNQ